MLPIAGGRLCALAADKTANGCCQLQTVVATKIKLSLSFCYIIIRAPFFVAGKAYLCDIFTKYLLVLQTLIK